MAGTLWRDGWDPDAGAWREYVDGVSQPVPLANTLATLAGLTPPESPGVEAQILATSSGTPSMRAWALRALVQRGLRGQAVDELIRSWGPLVAAGADTFWEDFASEGEQPTQMYGRPFGKSLCHGWSSGPADLLVLAILGTRPLVPGWAQFTVDPQLGDLEWAACVVPTVRGDVCVVAERGTTTVDVPAGTVLVHGADRFTGPTKVSW
ncbi:alpha-L-rhamnosidase C-terminal domain-containing protein [Actinomyces ruminis]|uniref:alpha-L-rhamnosidase C-terminal domain-containing protein n=1 Tax=Actinomyces ruminis TaxID=1937003 RepID=UPI000B64660A|nr:alpha-L-rhamnosidase C-terminal domain-containing protein [Actinomyces ruminis]